MKKYKKFIKAGAVLLIVAAIAITSLWGDETVYAASRMSGVQKVVNTISEISPFTIVEIVPDKSAASMGFLVNGEEPELPSTVVSGKNSIEERRTAAINWLTTKAKGLISYVSSNVYEEQLYRPKNMDGWIVAEYKDYFEERTGSYQLAKDMGLNYGNYVQETNADGEVTYSYAETGEYVWVDAAEGKTEMVDVCRVYCKLSYSNTNWFSKKVLEVDSANIKVKTFTPQDFEEMLRIGGISWNDIDLLVLGASEEQKYVSGDSGNDFKEWSSVVQIYNMVTGAKLPVILDTRILASTEETTNIQDLAYLLKAYDEEEKLIVGDSRIEETIAIAEDKAFASERSGEGVYRNIYCVEQFIDETLDQELETFYGQSEVESEFATEDFYNEVNRAEYTTEKGTDGYAFTRASLVKYIIHFGSKRTEMSKETIRVLDIEPTKYSLLTDETIRTWLGVTASDETPLNIEIVQTTTVEFNGLRTDLVEEFDLIYIGSCIGVKQDGQALEGSLNTDTSGVTVYNDKGTDGQSGLTGLIYSDVGDLVTVSGEFIKNTGNTENVTGLETRYSGNDITRMKLKELQEFANCGYPVIIADELYVEGRVKPTSNMYTFIAGGTVDNVMQESVITNNSIVLNRYVNLSKMNMTVYSEPAAYTVNYAEDNTASTTQIASVSGLEVVEGIVEPLRYTFEFSDDARVITENMYYKVQLFVDNDANGQFSSNEELYGLDVRDSNGNSVDVDKIQPGERYWVSKDLGSKYQGVLSWKLKVSLFAKNGTAQEQELSARSSATGMTYVPCVTAEGENTSATTIKVLQLTVGEDGFNLSKDSTVNALLNNLESSSVGMYDVQIAPISVNQYLAVSVNEEKSTENFYNFLCNYDMLLIGFSGDYIKMTVNYTPETIEKAISAIEMYIEAGKAVLFTGETTTHKYIDSASNYWGYALNRLVRKYAGMDRYGVLDLGSTTEAQTEHKEGFSNMILDANSSDTNVTYKSLVYAKDKVSEVGTHISQVNKGQITSFPYDLNIDTEMDINDTNAQAYQLDLDCDLDEDGKSDLIVWYCLAGGDFNAMPNDVRNSYYIHSLGNVTYTAMNYSSGSSEYETKLLVNTLIAAYNLGMKSPTVNILDDKEDKGSIIYDVYRPFDDEAGIYCDSDQEIYFHVKDNTVISGAKVVKIRVYKQVASSEDCNVITYDRNNRPVYLKVLNESLSSSNKMEYVYSSDQEDITYEVDDHVYSVTVSKDHLNTILVDDPSVNIYIGVQVIFMQDSDVLGMTEESFATLEIKKMSLFNLD